MTSFTINVLGSNVNLKWQTATEVNNYGFEIQRKKVTNDELRITSNQWEKIGFVQGYGNSNSPKSYSFTDEAVYGNKFIYRLKQIDFDGTFKYSDIVEVNIEAPTKFSLKQNYPNPFNPTTTIKYSIPMLGNGLAQTVLKVYDILGSEVATLVNEKKSAGNYEVKFDASGLSSGIYFYKLESGSFLQTRKLLLMK